MMFHQPQTANHRSRQRHPARPASTTGPRAGGSAATTAPPDPALTGAYGPGSSTSTTRRRTSS